MREINRLIFRMRPLSWLFRKDWYGFRWGQNGCSCDNDKLYLVDFGPITFGIALDNPVYGCSKYYAMK